MTETATRIALESREVWGHTLPPTIARLELALTAAKHAFDDIEQMSWGHRIRVVDEVSAIVPEAASAAAYAGHSSWAFFIVRLAAERPPAWSSLCTRWDAAIASALDAIEDAVAFAA